MMPKKQEKTPSAIVDSAKPGDRSRLSDAARFLGALFELGDCIIVRPIETWIEHGKKRSRVDWNGIKYLKGEKKSKGTPLRSLLSRIFQRSEQQHTNIFYGICPRFEGDGKFDKKWQIRTVRCLWADIDDTDDVSEVEKRCRRASLPEPSIIVHSGNGVHVYWLLAEPYLIDDVGEPLSVEVEWIETKQKKPNGQFKKTKREYIVDPKTNERQYLHNKVNRPELSPKAQHIEAILKGIATEIGGDHTTDLSRLLRVPGTLNRKDQRNGKEPVPCELVKCDADAKYRIDVFARFADAQPPQKSRQEQISAVPLPTPRTLSRHGIKNRDRFKELLFKCHNAPLGNRSELDFRLCCWAVQSGIAKADVKAAAMTGGKFHEGGEEYFERTWENAERTVREEFLGACEEEFGKGNHDGDRSCGDENRNQPGGLPQVYLPGKSARISDTADELGRLLNQTGEYFNYGGALMKIGREDSGIHLEAVSNASLPSVFESVASLFRHTNKGAEPTICSKQTAELIWESESFKQHIPSLIVVSRAPVLVKRNGKLVQISGYDRESEILTDAWDMPEMDLAEAKELLRSLLNDFQFASQSDYSRAMAAIITPALVLGGLLGGRAPIDLGEADESQTGKGFRNKITAAIYGHDVATVTQKGRGSVGSFEETFNSLVMSGVNFLSFDNVRGKIDSPALESFLTEDRYVARAPYSKNVVIDPRRTIIMMTSNRADITKDLANRCSCVRLRKRPDDYQFQQYPEGDILDHVHAHRERYLGAVFAIVKAWHDAGGSTTDEHRHDFRKWARVLDWIVQKLLDGAPLLDGHRETQNRMANPSVNWLRDVALIVQKSGRLGTELMTSDILDLLEDTDVEIPGLGDRGVTEYESRGTVLQAMGRKLRPVFQDYDSVMVEEFEITRLEDMDQDKNRPQKKYVFRLCDPRSACSSQG
jgi:hypothetical protein